MKEKDAAFGNALGPRKLHIVLQQRLLGASARQARNKRGLVQGQRERRQQHVFQTAGCKHRQLQAQNFNGLAATGRRQPLQVHREEQDEQHTYPEVGQRKAKNGASHDRLALPLLGAVAGIDTQWQSQHDGKDQTQHRQLQRGGHVVKNQPDGTFAVYKTST